MGNIFKYSQLADIKEENRLTLGEGQTEVGQSRIEQIDFFYKNEYQNPTKSFKDRSLAYQLSKHFQNGTRKFVISSSGNAALSAASLVDKSDNLELDIFVSEHINPGKHQKLLALQSDRIRIHQSNRAKSDAIQSANQTGAINLRGSQDDAALPGFRTIAYELAEQFPDLDAIFIPCSSGTSTQAIAEGFAEMNMQVKIFACQTTKINPIASHFEQNIVKTSTSLADAISDRVAHRKQIVSELIRKSSGHAYAISDEQLLDAKNKLAPDLAIFLTYNSILGIATLKYALNQGHTFKKPLVLLSGT